MRDGDFELCTLRSGARAVRHVGHGEVMHPAGGPWLEANRLYVDQPDLAGRLSRRAARGASPICIFDVGLGAATNAVAALHCARESGGSVEIHSFEIDLAPLRLALGDRDGFPFLSPFRDAAQSIVERGEWHGQWPGGGARWILHHGDLRDRMTQAPRRAELIYFDPFSPQNNVDLWTPDAFGALRRVCREDGDGALLFTYSAATPMRVSLLLGGFFVGAGVSTGTKRETTVGATLKSSLAEPLGTRWLARWQRSTARAPVGETVLTAAREREVLGHPQFAPDRSP